jgi:hypothetical protein
LGPPVSWVAEPPSLKVRRPKPTADHSSAASAKFKNEWTYGFSHPLHAVVACVGATLSFRSRKIHVNYLEHFGEREFTLFLYLPYLMGLGKGT